MNDDITRADSAVARAEGSLRKRETDLTKATEAKDAALVAWDASESDADRDKFLAAEATRAQKERKRDDALNELARSQEERKTLEKRRAEATYESKRTTLLGWKDALAEHVAAIVDADSGVSDAILQIALVLADAQELHESLERQALALDRRLDVARPDLAGARVLVRQAVTAARQAEDRDDHTSWLSNVLVDWKTRGQTEADVETARVMAERVREANEKAAAYQAGMQAAVLAATQPNGSAES